MTVKKVELEIEYARMVVKMDEHTKEKERLQKIIQGLQRELMICTDNINKLGIEMMAATIKLAKSRGRT